MLREGARNHQVSVDELRTMSKRQVWQNLQRAVLEQMIVISPAILYEHALVEELREIKTEC